MGYYIYAPDPPYVKGPRSGLTRINQTSQVWQIVNKFAVRIDVTNPPRFEAGPGETIWDRLRAAGFGHGEFHKTALGPGEFYPRLWRPSVPQQIALGSTPEWNPSAQHETNIANIIAIARGQLTTLMRQLGRICQTIQPEEKNLGVFGHDIRNLLILACTEAEAHWRGVLVANGVTQKRFCTGDYVKLRNPLKLNEYAVMFPNYPWLEAFKPYEGWGSTNSSTKDLEWYDAYNAVKHDRAAQFHRAALRHVFDAISACVIMMVSQFGEDEGLRAGPELQAFFSFSERPEWPLSDYYIPPFCKPPTRAPFDFKTTNSKR